MVDNLKLTIMEKLKENFKDIVITDTPINNDIKTKDYRLPKVLFKDYKDKNHKSIEVIDYETYNKYMEEKIPNFNNINIVNLNITENNEKKSKILEWDDIIGVLKLDKSMSNLHPYNSILYILNDSENVEEVNKDFIFVYSSYNYANTLNKNMVEYFHRFNIDVFIYNDLNNNKIDFYSRKIHEIFNRDFNLLNEDMVLSKDVAYIYNQLSFDMSEYNISNKILRGSMLIRTYGK